MPKYLDETGNVAGMPRPIDRREGLPVAFAMDVDDSTPPVVDYRNANGERDKACIDNETCHVCGETLGDDRVGIVSAGTLAKGEFDQPTGRLCFLDNWSMHLACAKLARAHCPMLKEYFNAEGGSQATFAPETFRELIPGSTPEIVVAGCTYNEAVAAFDADGIDVSKWGIERSFTPRTGFGFTVMI